MGGDQTRGGGPGPTSTAYRYAVLIALALAAGPLADLAVGLSYRAVTGDSFYYRVVHPDRGRNRRYRTSSDIYHHDLTPSVSMPAVWGDEYFVYTNSLGFRDREVREVDLDAAGTRVLLIGDSFTEGVRVDFDATLAGVLAAHFRPREIDVLNAGVSSYSPTIYERKVRHLIEDVGLRFTHLVVLLDPGDIYDEATEYSHDEKGNVTGPGQSFGDSRAKEFLRDYSVLYGLPRLFRSQASPPLPPPDELNVTVGNPRSRWTLDEGLYRQFGERGLRTAEQNMNRLAALLEEHGIRLTVAVYPHPAQILHGDVDSRHVRYWRDWCQKWQADFIDLFPGFIGDDQTENEKTIQELFIRHDVHWNEAGHRRAANLVIDSLVVP